MTTTPPTNNCVCQAQLTPEHAQDCKYWSDADIGRTTPSNDDLDAATRALIQTLLTIQYHEDLALVRDTPYRTRARRRHRQTALRNRYQGLGLHNTTIPVELQAW